MRATAACQRRRARRNKRLELLFRRGQYVAVNPYGHLLLLGRPAGGKSEFIEYLRAVDPRSRSERYRVGEIEVLSEYPWLLEEFALDDERERDGQRRLRSVRSGGCYEIANPEIFTLLADRIERTVSEEYASRSGFYGTSTLLIEITRGGPTGYVDTLRRFSAGTLGRSAILYVEVSFTESWRRNLARGREAARRGDPLRMVPQADMERFYRFDDWPTSIGSARDGFLKVNGVRIPYVTMNNEPETSDPFVLDDRYGAAMRRLADLAAAR